MLLSSGFTLPDIRSLTLPHKRTLDHLLRTGQIGVTAKALLSLAMLNSNRKNPVQLHEWCPAIAEYMNGEVADEDLGSWAKGLWGDG